MKSWIVTLLGFLAGLTAVGCQTAVVVDPLHDHEINVGIIVIPGAGLPGESYRPLAESIQRESPLRVWVALTLNYTADIATKLQLPFVIRTAFDELQAAGMPTGTPIFFAGHSQGGIVLQSYINRQPTGVAGMMLWASYLTGETGSLVDFPTPVMHLSGDLDGQVKITRIAKSFRDLEEIIEQDGQVIAKKPVVVVEGVNHFHFSSGKADEDLSSDITETEAWTLLALPMKDFIAYNLGVHQQESYASLNVYYQETHDKIAPLTATKELEWNGTSCTWVKPCQEMVAAFPDDLLTPVTIYSVGYSDQESFESCKPSVVKGSDGIAVITPRSKVEFVPNPFDNAGLMDSAEEIAVKMKSQEAISRIIKDEGYEESATCRQINEAAHSYAYNVAPEIVRSRYDTRGRQMFFVNDAKQTGSQWLNSHVTYEPMSDNSLKVTSTYLHTQLNLRDVRVEGMYYCKLMSPYRALEWMYVDSLRPVTIATSFT